MYAFFLWRRKDVRADQMITTGALSLMLPAEKAFGLFVNALTVHYAITFDCRRELIWSNSTISMY